MSDNPSPARPISASQQRPQSPRRPSPIGLEPIPNTRPTSARFPISPRSGSPVPAPASSSSTSSTSAVGNLDAMHAWLQAHMPPALQSGINSWCTNHAQPLLSGFLEQWMQVNAATLVDNKLAAQLAQHLVPMQQIMQQQQTMIAELQTTAQQQQATIQTLLGQVTTLQQQQQAAAAAAAAVAAAIPPSSNTAEPAPFTPTLPYAVNNPVGLPSTVASPPLGLGGGRKTSAGPHRGLGLGSVGGGALREASTSPILLEDGIAAPTDIKQLMRTRMSMGSGDASMRGSSLGGPTGGGLGLGLGSRDPRGPINAALASSTSSPAPGETIVSEDTALAGVSPQLGGKQKLGLGVGGGSPAQRVAAGGPGGRGKPSGPVDIIVVEDLVMAQKIAHAALTRGHFKVDIASDGNQALDLFKKHMHTGALKAVLMDIHLPGISGIETTTLIRRLEQEHGLHPVWIYGLTGDVAEEDLARYKECGMNGCILKGKLLADAVKQAMEASQNGVEFVNLCDKQGNAGATAGISSSAPGASRPAIVNASADAHAAAAAAVPAGVQPAPAPHERAHASAIEQIREEAAAGSPSAGQPTGVYGTPRAPLPRQLMLDNRYPGRGTVRPTIGLPHAGGTANGTTSPGATNERLMGGPGAGGAPGAPAGPNMLLVEDVRVSQKIAVQALQRAGFRVIAADDGETAVEKFRQQMGRLKYIIMDINLPGISGIEATEQIRALERSSGVSDDSAVYIFGLTGNVDPESMRNYQAAGMNGCILKGKVLSEALKLAIDEAQEGRFVNIS